MCSHARVKTLVDRKLLWKVLNIETFLFDFIIIVNKFYGILKLKFVNFKNNL